MVKRKNRDGSSGPVFYSLSKNNPLRKLNKNDRRTLFKTVIFHFILLLSWITFGKNSILDYLEVKKELTATIDRKETLENENKKLRQQIAKIQDDPEYLEKIARRRYYMTRKNEVLFKFD